MNKIILPLLLLTFSRLSFSQATTLVRVVFHSVSEISLVQKFECQEERGDLLMKFTLKSFEAQGEGFIRVQHDSREDNKNYVVEKNGNELKLNKTQGVIVLKATPGLHEHTVVIRVKKAPLTYCQKASGNLIFSLEPV